LRPHLPEDHPFRLFKNFARVVWKHLQLPEPTPLQLAICDYLQFGPDKLIIQAFRGAGKSYLTSAYACWLLLIDPQEMILCLSASKDRADLFTKFCRRLIDEIPILHHLRPDVERGDQDSSVSFQVGCCVPQQSPSVVSRGITGQITGSRATTIIPDDIEVRNNSETPLMRERLVTRIEEFSAILLPKDEERGIYPKVRTLGTPQTENSVYRTMEERGYECRIWPIMKPTDEQSMKYAGRLAPDITELEIDAGAPTEPRRFTRLEIETRRREYGRAQFALQFMLDTSLSDTDKYPLKIKDAMFAAFTPKKAHEVYVHTNHPRAKITGHDNPGLVGDGFFAPEEAYGELVPFEQTILCVDPSGRGKDETACVALSSLSGYIFVHSVFGLPGGYDQPSLDAIAREAKRVKANTIVIESNFGDGMFSQLLRPTLTRIYPCSIEEIRNTMQKERRIIDTLSPVFEGHRIIFHEKTIEQDAKTRKDDSEELHKARQMFWQATHISYERGSLPHDDRVDALAMGVGFMVESMSREAHAVMRQREMEEIEEMLERFDTDEATGAEANSWLSRDLAVGSGHAYHNQEVAGRGDKRPYLKRGTA